MPSQRPNILFIILDHHAHYGHDRPGVFDYKRPCFEKFAGQGVRFDRAYCVAPICTPARSSIMTGLYPSSHGLLWNTEMTDNPDNLVDFPEGTKLYSHYLAEKGYRNGFVGKWHCGHKLLPADYGMDGWSLLDYGKMYESDLYRDYCAEHDLGPARARIEHNMEHPEWTGKVLELRHESPWHFMNGSGVLEGPPEAHGDFFVAHVVSERMRELARSPGPWSLVASFWGPHQPYFPTEPYASMVNPKDIPEYPSFNDDLEGRPLRYIFHRDFNHQSRQAWPEWSTWQEVLARAYGQGYQTDAAVGRVLDALEETGQAENTLVIWCVDHGDALASHGGLWDKASTYIEEVARIPFAVRWPAGFEGGVQTDRLITNMDVTATMLEAAGATWKADEMHSRSILPICRDSSVDWPDFVVTQHHGHGDPITQRILVTDRYKYVAALFDGDEIYDLKTDPYEINNLIHSPEHEKLGNELRARLVAFIEETDDPRAAKLAHALKLGR